MVYVDEANLQHPNTIAECFNRTIASKSRKHFFTLNPDVPAHWLYTDYLDKYKEENQSGYRWFHFTLDDNPAISEERKAELKSQYTGVFYKRFILGLRVNAEGGCYPSFTENNVLSEIPKNIMFVEIGADIGGGKSATTNNATAYFKLNDKLCFCCIDETYNKTITDPDLIIGDWEQFARKQKSQYTCIDTFIDSAEQIIRTGMKKRGVCNIQNSLKAPIVDRIRFLDLMFSLGRAFIYKDCKYTINAVQSAVWTTTGTTQTRLDNGTSNIDSLDSWEYSWERRMKEII
jgi:PBSX family phage terminase large subunit